MKLKYKLDEIPPILDLFLLGFQWFVVIIPIIIIVGKIIGILHFDGMEKQITYIQKICFISALTILIQILYGHKLPLVNGPATVLLIGVIASKSFDIKTIYSSIMICGFILMLLGATRLFSKILYLFTPRIVAVVLLLIAFTLAPTIVDLITITNNGVSVIANVTFSMTLVFVMLICNMYLKGIWKNTIIIWSMIMGTICYYLIFQLNFSVSTNVNTHIFSHFFKDITFPLSFNPGVFISFLICYIALAINDLGSIQAMNVFLKPEYQSDRVIKGTTITGLAGIISGGLGIVGPVNFSFSPGVVASTKCASRYTLLPAALLLFIFSFSPLMIAYITNLPSVIVGTILLFIMSFQVSSGLQILTESDKLFTTFEECMIVGFPLLLGTIVAFMPPETVNMLPLYLRPIIANGFVVGVVSAFILEHFIYKR